MCVVANDVARGVMKSLSVSEENEREETVPRGVVNRSSSELAYPALLAEFLGV